mgnify:CR=1 FL=1
MSFTYVNFVRKLWVGLFARRKPESFNDTIGEIENILDLSPHEQHTIQVNSINMYTAIDECRRGVMEELVKVNTKYKSVDKKVKPVAILLQDDSWQRMKEVTKDLASLRDPKGIGHTFTDESRGELQVKKDDFLLPEEEERFQMMLERHGKAFAFSPQEIGGADLNRW